MKAGCRMALKSLQIIDFFIRDWFEKAHTNLINQWQWRCAVSGVVIVEFDMRRRTDKRWVVEANL